MDLIDLSIRQSGAEARPSRASTCCDVDAILGARIESTCRWIDLQRPNWRVWQITADVRPSCTSVCRLVNVAAPGRERSERSVSSHVARWVYLDVLHHTGHWQVPLRPSSAVIGGHKHVGRPEPACMHRSVDSVYVRSRQADRVYKLVGWIPTADAYSTDSGPGATRVCRFPHLVRSVQNTVAIARIDDERRIELLKIGVGGDAGGLRCPCDPRVC
jgi:hypothetical protein